MAKKRRSPSRSLPSAITQRSLTRLPDLNLRPISLSTPTVARLDAPLRPMNPLADRRTFHPDGRFRPVPVTNKNASRLVERNNRISFASPTQVITCMRRKTRKQVLFALKVGGQKGRKKRPRRNWLSAISC